MFERGVRSRQRVSRSCRERRRNTLHAGDREVSEREQEGEGGREGEGEGGEREGGGGREEERGRERKGDA
jgi:hypothetical protein